MPLLRGSYMLIIVFPILAGSLSPWRMQAYACVDSLYGGDPIFYQHIFYPEVHILMIPSFGLLSNILYKHINVIMFVYPIKEGIKLKYTRHRRMPACAKAVRLHWKCDQIRLFVKNDIMQAYACVMHDMIMLKAKEIIPTKMQAYACVRLITDNAIHLFHTLHIRLKTIRLLTTWVWKSIDKMSPVLQLRCWADDRAHRMTGGQEVESQ